jgi:hypothetical protein
MQIIGLINKKYQTLGGLPLIRKAIQPISEYRFLYWIRVHVRVQGFPGLGKRNFI